MNWPFISLFYVVVSAVLLLFFPTSVFFWYIFPTFYSAYIFRLDLKWCSTFRTFFRRGFFFWYIMSLWLFAFSVQFYQNWTARSIICCIYVWYDLLIAQLKRFEKKKWNRPHVDHSRAAALHLHSSWIFFTNGSIAISRYSHIRKIV